MDNTNFFDYSIVSRGRTIFREGNFKIKDENKNAINADVYGTNTYRVHLEFNNQGRLLINKSSCTCPCSYPCKHMAALVLYHDKQYKDAYDNEAVQILRPNKSKPNNVLNSLERSSKEMASYYSSQYSSTKYVYESLNKLKNLETVDGFKGNESRVLGILNNLLNITLDADYSYYYDAHYYYIDFDTLLKNIFVLMDKLGVRNNLNDLILAFITKIRKINSSHINKLLLDESTSSLTNLLIETIIKAKKTSQFFISLRIPYTGMSLDGYSYFNKKSLLKSNFKDINDTSKFNFIEETFYKHGKDDILDLIAILETNSSKLILNDHELSILDGIDHKLALKTLLNIKEFHNLDWISTFLSLVKEEDKEEKEDFDKIMNYLISNGTYTPLLLYPSSNIDIKKLNVFEIKSIRKFILDEYRQKVIDYIFDKANKDIGLKSDRSNEIASILITLNDLEPNLCSKLLLNNKLKTKIENNEASLAIYFMLLDKYNLLVDAGYFPYKG